jgi:hypothetical protein
MKTVARFVTRLQGKGDGLFFGSLYNAGVEYFKPNTIYEIKEVLGQLIISEIGQATGAGPDNCSSRYLNDPRVQFSWSYDIGEVISMGKNALLTETEHLAYINS